MPSVISLEVVRQERNRNPMSYPDRMKTLLNCDVISTTEFAVLVTLTSYSDAYGDSCFPSIATICKSAKVSRRTAVNAIKSLERYGFIHVERKKGRQNNAYIVDYAAIHASELDENAYVEIRREVHRGGTTESTAAEPLQPSDEFIEGLAEVHQLHPKVDPSTCTTCTSDEHQVHVTRAQGAQKPAPGSPDLIHIPGHGSLPLAPLASAEGDQDDPTREAVRKAVAKSQDAAERRRVKMNTRRAAPPMPVSAPEGVDATIQAQAEGRKANATEDKPKTAHNLEELYRRTFIEAFGFAPERWQGKDRKIAASLIKDKGYDTAAELVIGMLTQWDAVSKELSLGGMPSMSLIGHSGIRQSLVGLLAHNKTRDRAATPQWKGPETQEIVDSAEREHQKALERAQNFDPSKYRKTKSTPTSEE